MALDDVPHVAVSAHLSGVQDHALPAPVNLNRTWEILLVLLGNESIGLAIDRVRPSNLIWINEHDSSVLPNDNRGEGHGTNVLAVLARHIFEVDAEVQVDATWSGEL